MKSPLHGAMLMEVYGGLEWMGLGTSTLAPRRVLGLLGLLNTKASILPRMPRDP
jgi:hypothetical protein